MRLGLISGRGARVAAATVLVGAVVPVLSASALAGSADPPAFQPRSGADKSLVATQQVDPSNRAITLKFREGSGVRLRGGVFFAPEGTDVSGVNAVVRGVPGVTVSRMFQRSEADLAAEKARVEQASRRQQADLNLYYRVVAPAGADVAALLAALNKLAVVEAASSEPRPVAPPLVTADLSSLQVYRTAAPDGIGANVVSSLPGGKGQNIEISDVEYSWNVNHEDLSKAPAAVINNGTPVDPFNDNNHGTAVLGELVGDENGLGVTGIVSGATLNLVNANNTSGYQLANAINLAAAASTPGDVILIEQQVQGANGGCGASQVGCAPVEWVQAYYDAIVLATSAGINVVEAAGNGTQDLDSAPYAPLLARADSNAIIVGAGGAPGCTAPPHGKLSFSNFGSRVNLQGYGECVVTTGYGDLQNTSVNARYTHTFSGTSSASPIVAGAAGVLSSIAQARGVTLTPAQVRSILVDTGTPQQFGSAGNIGPLPNLARATADFSCTAPPAPTIVVAAPGQVTNGTPGDDVILGTAGADRIYGNGGNDLILGGGGNDDLSGGDGNDTLCGGAGADRLAGNNGNDSLFGGDDNDALVGGAGDDNLYGEAGSDILAGNDGTDVCVGGPDADTFAAPPSCETVS